MIAYVRPMMRWRVGGALMVTVVSSVVISLSVAPPYAGAQQACSSLNPGGARCSIRDQLNPPIPEPGSAVLRTNAPPGPRFVWLNTAVPCEAATVSGWVSAPSISRALGTISSSYSTIDLQVPGEIWIGELVDPGSGPQDQGWIGCVAPGDDGPPKPPPIPTPAEIWGAVLTFVPDVHLDPHIRGLTGLETRMWYEGPTGDSITLNLNGYTVSASIEAVGFGWDMGGRDLDGVSQHFASEPGTALGPAATHTFARPAQVSIVHDVTWAGRATISGRGVSAGIAVDLGQALLIVARHYEVIEIRTPLVGGQ